MTEFNLEKAALRGEPSHVWRAGQQRRLEMIRRAAGERARGRVLVDGCGLGAYLARLAPEAAQAVGLDIEVERTFEAHARVDQVVCAAGEYLPFRSDYFDLILSHEVLEHVQDDRLAVAEIVRTLRPGGRLVLFVPNRGYPFETHGVYWRGRYRFGNIPLVNWLPRPLRDRLAPHVRAYTGGDLKRLFAGLPVRVVERTVIFGAYDNIIARRPRLGKALRSVLQALESTPLRGLGLSHFWVVERI
ncbi:MAG TPA: class I SAM-dependent methyltransferase [Chloroflexi bacterium]|jgi:SAM-dependent methyltransferase|nr:class I SAM-dependent methyltransferase [Chloroflexota bacterium]HPO58165.1 class I SAM-dependent methyltransferase [Anaerolineaceae bacterium]